jgi:hypothetical protein
LRRSLRAVLVVAATLAAVQFAPIEAIAASPGCTDLQIQTGTCPNVTATNDDDKTTITGTQGGNGSGSSGGGGTNGDGSSTDDGVGGRADWGSFILNPTLDDLITFRPTPGVDHMEPDGWFIQGLDANFYSTGGSSVQSGTLLGQPARVRFTPVAWTWNYGDGTTRTRSTSGGTWRAQHIREFDPTSTSHVYTKRGTYWIDLTLTYRAEFTFGSSGWATIDGYLYLPANRLRATVGDAKTVLFNENCQQNPSGAGC